MNQQEIQAIVEKQRAFFHTGATLDIEKRIQALKKLQSCILRYEDEIGAALKQDLGKSTFESYMCESGLVLSELSYMLRHVRSYSREKRVRTPLAQFHSRSFKKPSPYGVTLIMSPWNYPFLLTIDPLVDAIAAGNTAVVKPSAYSPATSELMARILRECFPEEYVAVVTGIYRRLLDEKRQPTTEESRRLEQAFSRSGFTDGYWLGKKGPQMFGTRPENAPEPKELFAKAREMYENGRENRKIPVNLSLSVRRGEPVRLSGACTVHGGAAFAMGTGAVPEEARNRAVTAEELRQRLSKTGGTVFTADRIEIELDEGLTIPASAVNGLRRELLEELAKRRMDIPPRRKLPALPLPDAPEGGQAMRFTCSVQKAEQVTAALLAEKPAAVYVPVEELERLGPELDWGETELCACCPAFSGRQTRRPCGSCWSSTPRRRRWP